MGSVEPIAAPDVLAYYVPFHAATACWERHAVSLASYGALPQSYAYYAQGTLQGYLIHWGTTILDLAIAPQADAVHISTALLCRMRDAGFSHATLTKVPEGEPIGPALQRLGFTPVQDYLLMGQELA
jgi:hypothetical protein